MKTDGDIRNLLKVEYAKRRANNPRYSLRSFAKKLSISSAALSEILRGKRPITKKNATRILSQIGLSLEQIDALLSGLEKKRRTSDYALVDFDRFALISDWFYFAVHSLAETKTFSEDPKWIAKRLNILPSQAAEALRRLEQLKMLVRDESGKLVHSGLQYTTPTQIRNLAIQMQHLQALRLAETALKTFDVNQRDFSGMTMAIDPALLPEAKKRIDKFMDQLCAFLESGEKKEVFRFCAQLFPLSQPISEDVR